MKWICLIFFVSLGSFEAGASYESYARGLQSKHQDIAKGNSTKSIPGFATDSPPESGLNDHDALGAAMERVYVSNKHVDDLRQIAETRPYFRIDLENDPVIKNSTQLIQNPEKLTSGDLKSRTRKITYVLKKCTESKPAGEYKCQMSLLPPEVHVDPAKYSHYWCSQGNHRPDDPRCSPWAKRYYNPARKYQDEVIHVLNEKWTSTCQNLEAQSTRGICKLVRKVCTDGPSTREVSATIGSDKKPTVCMLKRDCWRYEHIYSCSHPSKNDCGPLLQSSCEQYKSECIRKIKGACVEWEQTYRCPTEVKEGDEEPVSKAGYVLPQTKSPLKAEANKDFNEAMTKLAVFNSIQEDMRKNGSADSINVFKGESRKCTIAFGNFKNCCTDGKGWGVSLNLSGCDGEEKDLAERQSKGLCYKLPGDYCAEKVPVLGCIRKKRAYCCFPSKLSRILHEQGRPQVGKSWGEPEHPSCVGFTPEELSRLDFDSLNLNELYSEIVSRAKQQTVSVVQRNLSDRVSSMTHSFKNQSTEGVY